MCPSPRSIVAVMFYFHDYSKFFFPSDCEKYDERDRGRGGGKRNERNETRVSSIKSARCEHCLQKARRNERNHQRSFSAPGVALSLVLRATPFCALPHARMLWLYSRISLLHCRDACHLCSLKEYYTVAQSRTGEHSRAGITLVSNKIWRGAAAQ